MFCQQETGSRRAGRVQTCWRKVIGPVPKYRTFYVPFSFTFSLYCYGQLVTFFTLTHSVVLQFIHYIHAVELVSDEEGQMV